MSHWKVYEPIENTAQFNERGVGPFLRRIEVTANVHPSDAFPLQRIQIVIGRLATAGITVEQVDDLIDRLQRAKADIIAGRSAEKEPARGDTP